MNNSKKRYFILKPTGKNITYGMGDDHDTLLIQFNKKTDIPVSIQQIKRSFHKTGEDIKKQEFINSLILAMQYFNGLSEQIINQ